MIDRSQSACNEELPVYKPILPPRDTLIPYIDRIDGANIYTNFGPLTLELSQRLSKLFGLPPRSLVTASSGTTALTAAILAEAGPATEKRPIAAVPSLTFVATPLAAEQCGYEVVAVDVDETTWMLDPDSLRRHVAFDKVGLVIPVAPFGRYIAQKPWLDFRHGTGIPVVIDAAACFETVIENEGDSFGDVPTVLSFHATKSFSTAEGGAVVSKDPACVLRTAQALNFGFLGGRNCRSPGLNGKMSEYHAAVGLAELDTWPTKTEAFWSVARHYEREFEARGIAGLINAPEIASCYVLLLCRNSIEAARVKAGLTLDRIGHREWYGQGIHAHSHFQSRKPGELPVTNDLSARLIGLPAGPSLSLEQIERIAASISRHVQC